MKKSLQTELQQAILEKVSHAAITPVWLDKQDILSFFNISSRTLQSWRSERLIPYVKIKGKIFYPASALNWLMEKIESSKEQSTH